MIRKSQVEEERSVAWEPWLIFTSMDDFKPRQVMKIYSRRKQRDEKSERFGFGLGASYTHGAGRSSVLSLLATLSSIVLWLIGFYTENKGIHLNYQANSTKSRRVISHLTLAENILRHSPLILFEIVLNKILKYLTKIYHNMVLIY